MLENLRQGVMKRYPRRGYSRYSDRQLGIFVPLIVRLVIGAGALYGVLFLVREIYCWLVGCL